MCFVIHRFWIWAGLLGLLWTGQAVFSAESQADSNLVVWPKLTRIKVVGKPAEQARIGEALQSLYEKSATIRQVIQQLETNKPSVIIKPGTGENTCKESWAGIHIRFNPNGLTIRNGAAAWQHRPPEVGLGHELIHALHYARKTRESRYLREEWKTIGLGQFAQDSLTENALRKEYNLEPRPEY